MVELVVLCEELGFACAPLPFLSNAAAGLAIEAAGSRRAEVRAGCPGSPPARAAAPSAIRTSLIDGRGRRRARRARRRRARSSSTCRRRARAARPDRRDPPLLAAARRRRRRGAARRRRAAPRPDLVAVAAELVGVGQRAMEMAVEYAKEREQFERPIGAYQGVSHACAKMLYDVEEARSLTYSAAWAADAEPESLPTRRGDGQGAGVGGRLGRLQGLDPGPRRNRLHLGARPALPAQAGPRRRAAVRHRGAAQGAGRRARPASG